MSLTAPNRWAVLGLVCVAQFMVILDATIVNVALPTIEKGLHFSPTGLQWIVNAYTLVFGGFLLLGGRAAARRRARSPRRRRAARDARPGCSGRRRRRPGGAGGRRG